MSTELDTDSNVETIVAMETQEEPIEADVGMSEDLKERWKNLGEAYVKAFAEAPDESEDMEESAEEQEPVADVQTLEELQDSISRQQEHLSEIRLLVDCIESYKSAIVTLKDRVKTNQKLLEAKQEELNTLVLRGVSEQRQFPFMVDNREPNASENAPKMDSATLQASDDWKSFPVSALSGLTEKEIEKLSAEFNTCGEVCEWIGSDYSKKVAGIGEKTREKIQTAIDGIAGVTDEAIHAEAERGKAERENTDVQPNEVHSEPQEIQEFLTQCESLLTTLEDEENFDSGFLTSVIEQVSKDYFYTDEQKRAVCRIESSFVR